MSEFFTYKIRKGDTLSSLSLRTGISPEELKIFHNGNCGKMDKIWLDNLLGVDYILLPLNIAFLGKVKTGIYGFWHGCS